MRASQRKRIAHAREAVSYVRVNFPPGTRLVCNEKKYQIGTKYGMSEFWMLDVAKSTRGTVSATTIMDKFELDTSPLS